MATREMPDTTGPAPWLPGGNSAARAQNMGAPKVDDNLNGAFSGVTPLLDFVPVSYTHLTLPTSDLV